MQQWSEHYLSLDGRLYRYYFTEAERNHLNSIITIYDLKICFPTKLKRMSKNSGSHIEYMIEEKLCFRLSSEN